MALSSIQLSNRQNRTSVSFEIFVQTGFSDIEVASVVTVLDMANQVSTEGHFQWSFISDEPGLVKGRSGMIVRSEPTIFDVGLKDQLVVVGGMRSRVEGWKTRVRAMQAKARPVAILSEAATEFIQLEKSCDGPRTTQWWDVFKLTEAGDYPSLKPSLAASHAGIVTSPGSGYTMELILSQLSDCLSKSEIAEISSRLMIDAVRDASFEQPKSGYHLTNRLNPYVCAAIQTMDAHIDTPLSTEELAELIGISTRQLERLFRQFLDTTPAKYYRQMRVRAAHHLVVGTGIPLLNVALATGFSTVSTLSLAYRTEYGRSPTQTRAKALQGR